MGVIAVISSKPILESPKLMKLLEDYSRRYSVDIPATYVTPGTQGDETIDPTLILRFATIHTDESADTTLILEQLGATGEVEKVEVGPEPEPLYRINDSLPSGYNDALRIQKLVDPEGVSAWDITRGSGAVIGIAEVANNNGFNYAAPELSGILEFDLDTGHPIWGDRETNWQLILKGQHAKFILTQDASGSPHDPYYNNGHGSLCARAAAGIHNNWTDSAGTAPEAKIKAMCISELYQAINLLADQGCDIISVSYRPTVGFNVPVEYALSKGALVCWAHGANVHTEVQYDMPKSIMVSHADTDLSNLFSYGRGLVILGMDPESDPSESGATAAIAGICALIKSKNPWMTPFDIYSALINTATPAKGQGDEAWTEQVGYGVANALDAVQVTESSLRPIPFQGFSASISYPYIHFSIQPLRTSLYSRTLIVYRTDRYPRWWYDGKMAIMTTATEIDWEPPGSGTYYFLAFDINVNELHSMITPRNRAIVYNFPEKPLIDLPYTTPIHFIPSVQRMLDLTGSSVKCNQLHSYPIRVRNIGTAALIIDSVTVTSERRTTPPSVIEGFFLGTIPSYVLLPGEYMDIPLNFIPRTSEGVYTGILTIQSNSTIYPTMRVYVRWKGR